MPLNVAKHFNNLKLRWKLLVVVLPLVVIPIFAVGGVVAYISTRQAYRGITQTSKDDLDHMASFTLDLLNSHYQQFEVFKQDKRKTINKELTTLVNFAYNVVETENAQVKQGKIDLATAQLEAKKALKRVNVG
ncbi:MAG: histidine kinase, partial [Desulfuromonadales bacterium]